MLTWCDFARKMSSLFLQGHAMNVYPVIDHIDATTTLDQASLAFEAGADGVFLISHNNADNEIIELAKQVKINHKTKKIGLNLLNTDILLAAQIVLDSGIDMLWGDRCGVSSIGLNDTGIRLSQFAKMNPEIQVFASVAFKYQETEPNPELAALIALSANFMPTTSGAATGKAPDTLKIKTMSFSTSGVLAIASGMTVDNIKQFSPFVSDILVATGVSTDEYHFDFELLSCFISLAKQDSCNKITHSD